MSYEALFVGGPWDSVRRVLRDDMERVQVFVAPKISGQAVHEVDPSAKLVCDVVIYKVVATYSRFRIYALGPQDVVDALFRLYDGQQR